MASVGVACGLGIEDLGYIYFDAHDDMDTPSTNTNGYFDAMGLSMLAGKSWHTLTETIPGFYLRKYDKFVYCGLRDVSDGQRQVVEESGAKVIFGDAQSEVDFSSELKRHLDERDYSPALIHLDLDVLDESVGKVNGFESPGGLTKDDLIECMHVVAEKAEPVSLTVCSFNPNLGDGDKIAAIAVESIIAFFQAMMEEGKFVK